MKIHVQLSVLALIFLGSIAAAGTWGVGSFENDDALEFVSEVLSERMPEPISGPFKHAHHINGYIDATLGARILVAAEAYAAMNGKPGDDLPEEFATRFAPLPCKPDRKIIGSVEKSVRMVMDVNSSELAQLWRESPDYEKWIEGVQDLLIRLR